MKKLLSLLVVAVFLTIASFGLASTNVNAKASNCDAHGIGNRTMTNSTNNTAYKIHGNTATVTFNVVGKNCNLPISIIAWKAPNGTTGKPYSKQTMFAHKTKSFKTGRHSMTITLPDCFFQVDTVTGTKLTGSTGGAHNYDSRQVAFMHGGKKSCTPPVVKKIQVCELATKKIITISKKDFDSKKHSKNLKDCVVKPTPKLIEVCELSTKNIIKIQAKEFNATKHSKNLKDCVEHPIKVCELSTKTLITIDEKAFDSSKHSMNFDDCKEAPVAPVTPVTPTELPQTGPAESMIRILGAGSLTGSLGYWIQSRRNLKG